MVRPFDRHHPRALSEALDDFAHQRRIRQLIPGTLKEQQGDADLRQMIGAVEGRPFGGMQRKPHERDTADGAKRSECLGL